MIKIPYNEYKEYPEATSASKAIRVSGFFLWLFLILALMLGISSGDLISLVLIPVIVLHWYIQSKHDAIISFIIKRSVPESKRRKSVSEEELKIAKAKQRKAKYMLSIGVRHPEFREEAKKAEMTEQEYKKYCKEIIAMYDEAYRNYNETHYPPAEY